MSDPDRIMALIELGEASDDVRRALNRAYVAMCDARELGISMVRIARTMDLSYTTVQRYVGKGHYLKERKPRWLSWK